MNNNQTRNGIIVTIAAYLLWGFLPIYWKLVEEVPAGEILAHRIVWSFILMIGIVLILRKWTPFIQECFIIFKNRKRLLGITLASLFISLNWLTFIWAVNSDHVIQASLGYYINPLISIVLGIVVLKESVTRRQVVSFIFAGIGVLYLTFSFGVFPWVSLLLALTFGVYGLLKKMVNVSAIYGLTIETMIITPIAAIYLFSIPERSVTSSSLISPENLLLIGAGVATAVPLLLFASGAKKIPLAMVGFLQYIAPTIMLILGVFLYNEPFTSAHIVAFLFIWSALFIYMGSTYRRPMRHS
ncbi:chloramphenicol-sensitive protein RarD [Virgibacillus natechei]|uniref:Chloramphenicol-sensitive protein RarD n=1 Tax=Virgibacillus natechei TaxID=1216297 RepID=A0ABS4IGP1_9BACI|nr:EamA family transporter RarD [Virgibacillus natechei]MBP1969755.1 chloramphenicol-sensitive protein RarD [Virgibacillus natechei]UZD12702.1 EamA family transporter RarD [Virgibacillus natechei]